MPLMGGIEFLEKSYQKRKDPPVLIISSVNRTDVDLATKALRLGAFDYIEKPAMNNLQKSVDEILTKTKMALRSSKSGHISPDADDFNSSIGEKIVVPDASQCIRWVTTTALSTHLLEPILRMQMTEFRSPPLVISTPQNDLQEIEAKVRLWSPRNVEHLRQAKVFLRPNFVYLCDSSLEADVAEALKVKSFSLQILSSPQNDLAAFSRFKNAQVLMDESLAGLVEKTISRSGLSLSDITPSTSFVSLSLEYFANIRKAKAA
ncbi:MAG: response regulator [Proteobacteria bacterium]|nr:response regulator [Pseudomonadota bacterium]